MKNYIQHDPWNIIEEGFHPEYNEISESIFSLGNGRMGQRGNFEEKYSGKTLRGTYVAGIYYPDTTRVGWWKVGYPDYYAKVLNSANWNGINFEIEGEELDLFYCKVEDFRRVLNMQEGYLERSFRATLASGKQVKVHITRFCSIVDDEAGAVRYSITPLNFDAPIRIIPYIDVEVRNRDANYGEMFWNEIDREIWNGEGYVVAETKKTHFHVCTGMRTVVKQNGHKVRRQAALIAREKYVANVFTVDAKQNDEITVFKYIANISSENHPKEELIHVCKEVLHICAEKKFAKMLEEQSNAWRKKWTEMDVLIEGDVAAQQGIRFNIFQLHQTYTGEDQRLNISPKGFTGEKYGGNTYWDTEAYCFPFYMSTASQNVARNLLIYRYKHLQKAIENAEKLGFKNGAALYPMVTLTGEECHNEWEITFEAVHRNGAIAYAIYNYVKYTGDVAYLSDYGMEVLVAIARFWAQRVNWSEEKEKYVILGVTGPNDYENNVNNNWYTNYIASWCMRYAVEAMKIVAQNTPERYAELVQKWKIEEQKEGAKWEFIAQNMYFPESKKHGIFLQQDGYLDKELLNASDIPTSELPLNQHWSWDKILRSCFIKQTDTLLGLYLFEDDFDDECITRNFDFYEPKTVHESSLSACTHAVIAAKIGEMEKAYSLYLRTSRLDLDDYNNDTENGCHITSMAGTWLAVVQGFGGMRVKNDKLYFHPQIPKQWKSYSFNILFREWSLKINISQAQQTIDNQSDTPIELVVSGRNYQIPARSRVDVSGEMVMA